MSLKGEHAPYFPLSIYPRSAPASCISCTYLQLFQFRFCFVFSTSFVGVIEYASPVWCPYLVKNIVLLEKVQRRASRLALGQRRGEMSYEDRCEMLRWSQLTDRRLYFSLIECYKLVFGLNSLCFSDFFEFASKRTRSNHNYKLQVKSANCNCYKYSFFVKIIREWNDLPANVVEIGNLRRFKIALKSYMRISQVFIHLRSQILVISIYF